MKSSIAALFSGALATLAACGPSISESRLVHAPSRASDCSLEFLQLTVNQVSPMAPEYSHEILGHVVLGEEGVQDPMQQKYRDIVRPRACAMGGEAVAILQQATSSRALVSSSAVDYAVVREKPANAAPPPPSKF